MAVITSVYRVPDSVGTYQPDRVAHRPEIIPFVHYPQTTCVDARANDNEALRRACMNGHRELVERLQTICEDDQNLDRIAPQIALAGGHRELVERLLKLDNWPEISARAERAQSELARAQRSVARAQRAVARSEGPPRQKAARSRAPPRKRTTSRRAAQGATR